MALSKQAVLTLLRRHLVATICGALLLVVAAVYGLRIGALGEAKAELDQCQSEEDAVQRNLRNAADLDNHLAALKEAMVKIEARLIRSDDIAAYQSFFYKLEKDTGVKIGRLQPVATTRTGRPGAAAYKPIGFDLLVEGTFPKIVGFLRAMECSPRHYRLVSFSLQRSAVGGEGADGARVDGVALNLNFELLGSQ